MDVADVHPVFHGMQAELIGGADHLPALHAASRHPDGKACRVVVATVALLAHRRAAKLSAPDNERFIEQASLLEVGEQARDRFVHRAAEPGMVFFDAGVRIPLAAGAAEELNEPHAPLDQPAGQEAVAAKGLGLFFIKTVEPAGGFRLLGEINCLGSCLLHAEGELIAADAGFQFALLGPGRGVGPVEVGQQRERLPLPLRVKPLGGLQVANRLVRSPIDPHALVGCRHKPAAPVARPVDRLPAAVAHRHKCGQVFVGGAKAVVHPRAKRRPPGGVEAGVHLADAAGMVDAVGGARADHGDVIELRGDVRDPIRRPEAALPVLLPAAG